MLAGSFAGAVAAAFTNPLDVIKTKLQTQNLEPCVKLKNSAVLRAVSQLKTGRTAASAAVGTTAAASTMAAATAPGAATVGSAPSILDATEEKVRTNFRGAFQVAKHIWNTEGIFGFYRGMVPRMMISTPAVAISWTTYETLKTLLMNGELK